MIETGERMESRKPQDRVAKPSMDVRYGRADMMRLANERWYLHTGKKRQGMPFERSAGHGG